MKKQIITKSMLQWIDTLDSETKKLAMSHFGKSGMNKKFLERPFKKLEDALMSAFVWEDYEGAEYWENIIKKNKKKIDLECH